MLTYKRNEIISLMSKGQAFQSYLEAFSSVSDEPSKNQRGESERKQLISTMDGLFNAYYDFRAYLIPIAICTILIFVACSVLLVKAGVPDVSIPDGVAELGKRLPMVVLSALAGAYVWGLYEMCATSST